MTEQTKNQIRQYLRDKIPNLKEEDLNDLQGLGFIRSDVAFLAKEYKVSDPEGLANAIYNMKESTAVTPRPLPSKAMPVGGFGSKAKKLANRWTVVALTFVVLMASILVVNCQKDGAVSKSDIATLKSDVAALKNAVMTEDSKGNLVTVMDVARDIRTNTAKSSDLNGLVKKSDLDGLVKKDDLSGLAKRSDLDGLAKTKHLRRIERKLDAHIAAGTEQSAAPINPYGTVTVIVRKVGDK